MPTQRVLARQFGVTLTTVTRAYVEAQRRGLLSGEVGRGTFVRISSFQNPTAAFMSDERRQQIANVAIEHRLTVIEDDVFGFLAPEVKPLSSYLPEDQFFHITRTSKSIAPGIRIGYLLAPASAIERLSVSVLRTMVNAPPAMAELSTSLITDGVAGRIAEWKRKEIVERQAIASRVLAVLDLQTQAQSPHLWVRLPEPWRTDAFVARARGIAAFC